MHVRGTSIYLAVTFLSSTTAVLAAVPPYGQCGGKGFSGETTCSDGWTCTKSNDYYSQCAGGSWSNAPAPAPAPAASSKPASSAKPAPTSSPSTLKTVVATPTVVKPVDVTSTPSAIVVAPSSVAPAPAPSSGAGANGASCSLDAKFKALGKKYFGVATDKNRLTAGQNEAIIKANFGQVTPENSMKWDATENVQDKYTLDTADFLVDW